MPSAAEGVGDVVEDLLVAGVARRPGRPHTCPRSGSPAGPPRSRYTAAIPPGADGSASPAYR
jgi:hypothetical protein